MYCKNCGEEIDDKAAICVKCGVYIEEKKKKNVIFAFLWSFIISGAGQCYNGEWGKGTLMFIAGEVFGFFVLFVVFATSSEDFLIMWILVFAVWIASMIDAVSVAQKINKGDLNENYK